MGRTSRPPAPRPASAGDRRRRPDQLLRRHGAPEYLVWNVLRNGIVWLQLRDGEYVPLEPDADGITRSHVFPGLWLDAQALVDGDMARVLGVLQEGLASPEHAAFVARLAAGG